MNLPAPFLSSPLRCNASKVLWSASALLALAGCRASSSKSPSDDLKAALDPEIQAAKASSKNLKNIVIKDWKLGGQDKRHRPVWSLSARETRIGEGSELSPKRATLLDASARLFRDGKLESSFQAARIEFISTDAGLRLQMSGGVRGQTSAPARQSSKAPQSTLGGSVTLQAPRVDVSVQSRRLFAPQNVKLTAGQGAQAIVIESKTLRADSGLGVAQLGGGVRARSGGGNIASQNAVWNWKSGRSQASGGVSASREGTTLRGNKLEADVRGERGVLSGDVRAQSKDKNGVGQGRAGAINFDWQARTLLARDGVLVQRGGATLQASRIDTDLKLDNAIASGGVSLQRDGATLRAQRLDTLLSGDRATASGGVSLQRDNVSMRADRVQAFDRLTRAVASGDVSLLRDDLTVRARRVEARGIGRQSTLMVNASGGVRARNAQGQVRAERVSWSNGQVVGSGGVWLQKDGYVLTGAQMTSDERFERASLSGDVRGTAVGGGTIKAARLVKNGVQLSASGGVQARRGAVRLSGGRLDTTINGRHARLSGGVYLRTADGARLDAPSLRYDQVADKVYGEGGVRYFDKARSMNATGRTIVVNRVSDEKRREAVITGGSAEGKMQSLQGLKLF